MWDPYTSHFHDIEKKFLENATILQTVESVEAQDLEHERQAINDKDERGKFWRANLPDGLLADGWQTKSVEISWDFLALMISRIFTGRTFPNDMKIRDPGYWRPKITKIG